MSDNKPVIEGMKEMTAQLRALAAKATADGGGRQVAVAVGYTAAYAYAVHEDTAMKWKGYSRDPRVRRIEMGGDPTKARPRPRKREPKGRYWDPQGKGKAKFLEDPARRLRLEFAQIIVNALKQGKTMGQALLLAGLLLQRESQKECPVDVGNLKASAFTRLETMTGNTPTTGDTPPV